MKNVGIKNKLFAVQGASIRPSPGELTRIQNYLETRYQKIIYLSYRTFLAAVADYIKFVLNSAIYSYLKDRIQQEKQQDSENYKAMKNKEDRPWRLSPSIWLAWEKIGVIYDVVYKGQELLELESEVNSIGIHSYIEACLGVNRDYQQWERERDTREVFDRVHSFIMDEIFALQNQTFPTQDVGQIDAQQNSKLLVIPHNKKYKEVYKIAEILLSKEGNIDNFSLAKCIKVRLQTSNKKLTRTIYKANKKKYDSKIQNRFRTLNQFWNKIGYKARFSKDGSKIVRTSGKLNTSFHSKIDSTVQ